jgi:phosphopantetheinyl transferase (holo-ACP synthase)
LVKTSEILGEDHQDQEAILSISHDGDYATAVCMGFNQEEKNIATEEIRR